MSDHRRGGRREVLGNIRGRQGGGEQMPLHKIAAEVTQALQLIRALHAFGYDLKTKAVGQGNDRLHDGIRPVGIGDALDEGAVDLERTDGKLVQVTQAGVAATKVGYGKVDAQGSQAAHLRGDLRTVA